MKFAIAAALAITLAVFGCIALLMTTNGNAQTYTAYANSETWTFIAPEGLLFSVVDHMDYNSIIDAMNNYEPSNVIRVGGLKIESINGTSISKKEFMSIVMSMKRTGF